MNRSNAPGRSSESISVRTRGPVIAERLAELQAAAASDPAGAQEDLWAWIKELGARRDGAALMALFELGTLPDQLDGPADGLAVTALTTPLVDLPMRLLMGIWMPWRGKVFDAGAGTGTNRLTPSSVLPVKLVWPLYRVRRTPDGPVAFEFVSGVESGMIEPRVPVLKIDYEPISRNPIAIRRIRDELVELVPRTHLGRVLLRLPRGRFTNIGYFALRQPARHD